MAETKSAAAMSWWQRFRDWVVAADEAIHTTEFDLLRHRLARMDARLGALEARQQLAGHNPAEGGAEREAEPGAVPAGGP